MEETITIDKTTMIKLPEKAVIGLAPMNIQLMKQTAVDVNEAWAVAGNAIKASCETLYNLKRNVKRGNWTAFINSGVLNISAKNASDLVNAYDKWLVFSDDVPVSLLSTMSPRTLSAVANTDEKTRNIILSKVVSAVKTSESDVRKIIKEATPNRNSLKIRKEETEELSDAELIAKLKKEKKQLQSNLEDTRAALAKARAENEALEDKMNKMQDELSMAGIGK